MSARWFAAMIICSLLAVRASQGRIDTYRASTYPQERDQCLPGDQRHEHPPPLQQGEGTAGWEMVMPTIQTRVRLAGAPREKQPITLQCSIQQQFEGMLIWKR